MTNCDVEALETVLRKLRKERQVFKTLTKKEEERKKNTTSIKLKNEQCYSHEEIEILYMRGRCTRIQCDKAHDRFDKVNDCNTNDTEKYMYEIYSRLCTQLNEELQELRLSKLPIGEQEKLFEKRNY